MNRPEQWGVYPMVLEARYRTGEGGVKWSEVERSGDWDP